MMLLYHEYRFLMRKSEDNPMSMSIVRAARLGCGFHPCGALQFIRAAKAGGALEGFR